METLRLSLYLFLIFFRQFLMRQSFMLPPSDAKRFPFPSAFVQLYIFCMFDEMTL